MSDAYCEEAGERCTIGDGTVTIDEPTYGTYDLEYDTYSIQMATVAYFSLADDPEEYGTYGIADILAGNTIPSGHLSDTYAVDTSLSPAMVNYGIYLFENEDEIDITSNNALRSSWYLVETESEALNTLLTEKSLYCAQHNIRLQCFVNDIHREQLVHINVQEQGGMLMCTIEHYCDAPLHLVDGLPVTSKQDKTAHGFGLKSIRMIAQKYGGKLRISCNDNVFTLTIAIPV
ncbi:MAG: GHKL domain-containing protein [Clostridiales bacterium]|nr:GHKL domain-containing protein [Clostridiales bacterium]